MVRARELQGKAHIVLVAADDGGLREALAFMLKIEGYAVSIVSNAKAALTLTHFDLPRCLVVDDSPIAPALSVLGELRSAGCFSPAFVLTGRGTRAMATAAAVLGARVVEKPLTPADFLAAVEAALAG